MDNELKSSVLKTGTSIVGIVCKDGVVMAADRKATAGSIVISKNTKKLIPINNYLAVAIAGNASDAEMLIKIIRAELKLKQLRTRIRPTIKEAANLIGSISYHSIRQFKTIPTIVGTLAGGINPDGTTELFTIEPAGGAYKVDDYDANFSSGMPFILGFLERNWKKSTSVKEGIELAIEALKSSTQRDTASGHGIDVFTITKDGIIQVVEHEIEPTYKERKK
ncbi:proteasome subunit beta [Candidatus Pacearchaeota archaeon]|nr:proteasome subunit beta [Candidatus Pacearchaeota archaeon]